MSDGAYAEFLASKTKVFAGSGISVDPASLPDALFPWQRQLVTWALRKGRAALWTTTGSGKTLLSLAWGSRIADRCLIVAPLGVAHQTVREGERFGIPVTYARNQAQASPSGITITNYEMLRHFDATAFPAVVLDESAILANFSGTVKRQLVEAFRETPYRLCCTATPAPNDVVELCNHADFLGMMSPADMLSRFFISKGDDAKAGRFRLKRHAHAPFFRWLASWAMAMNAPSDLGFADGDFVLPELSVRPLFVETEWKPADALFFVSLKGIVSRAAARRGTVAERVAATADLIAREPHEPWLVWCGLNDEQDMLARVLGDRCISIYGSLSAEEKVAREAAWRGGSAPVLLTKLECLGYGMNWQHCARMAFLGLGDSWQRYYQGIRRCWRFGQHRPVAVHLVLSAVEQDIYNNVMRKETEAIALGRELVAAVARYEREELAAVAYRDSYEPTQALRLPDWLRPAPTTAEEAIPA